MIRLTVPSIGPDDLQAVRDALASGFLVQGRRVAAFEQAVADSLGVKFAVATSSGTAALHLGLLAAGVGAGDVVIVTAYSWIATANVIELCGARPVFVDIRADTFNMDPARLEAALKGLAAGGGAGGRVKAVLPVHTFGQMADMPAIGALAGRHGACVIEDAACALGATWAGRQAGTFGRMGCLSFHPRKAITTGEGGMVVTNDPELDRRLRALRNHGQDPGAASPDFILPGFNYRMTEFQAALGTTQMTKLDRIISARRRLAEKYDELLAGSSLTPPAAAPAAGHVYQSYVALLPEQAACARAKLIAALKEQAVETTVGTIHMPMTTYYRQTYGHREGDFPVTDDVASRSLTLPLYEKLLPADQEYVVKKIEELLSSLAV